MSSHDRTAVRRSVAVVLLALTAAAYAATVVLAPPVKVRWVSGMSTETRREAERRYGLARGQAEADGRTWAYSLMNPSTANLTSLIVSPQIEDTAGLDRTTASIPGRVGTSAALRGVLSRTLPAVGLAPWIVFICLGIACGLLLALLGDLIARPGVGTTGALSVVVAAGVLASTIGGVASPWLQAGWAWLVVLALGLVATSVRVALSAVNAGATLPTRAIRESKPTVFPSTAVGAGLFTGLYVCLVAWFFTTALWHQQFGEAGGGMRIYSIARAMFAGYLFVMLTATGALALRRFERRAGPPDMDRTEVLLAWFFAGASIWIAGMYVAGLLGLYYRVPALALTAIILWRAYPDMARWLRARPGPVVEGPTPSLTRLVERWVPLVALAVTLSLVYVNRGLAITETGYDGRGHYVPYYEQVVTTHGTAPNDLWYHFWVSKGAGLHFLASLLTDIHGPLLVSSLMVTVALLVVVSMVRGLTGQVTWGLTAGVLFAAPLMTGAQYWKHHLVTLTLVAGVVWLLTAAWRRRTVDSPYWVALTTVVSVAAVINAPPIAALLGLVLAAWPIAALGTTAFRMHRPWWPCAATLGAALSILAVNYGWTGLAEVTPFRSFHGLANQDRLAEYVSPYVLVWLDEATGDTTGQLLAGRSLLADVSMWATLTQLTAVARPAQFVLTIAAGTALAMRWRAPAAWRRRLGELGPAALLLGLSLALAMIVDQPQSIERFYLFNLVPLVVIGSTCVWLVLERLSTAGRLWRICAGGISFGIVTVGAATAAGDGIDAMFREYGKWDVGRTASFVSGRMSFANAVGHNIVSRDCLEIASLLPVDAASIGVRDDPRHKVWSLHLHDGSEGCHTLPGVRIMSEMSNGFGPRWHTMVFGDPEESIGELQRQHVRHFYLNLSLSDDGRDMDPIIGCMAYSPLFEPDSLQANFQVIGERDGRYLLELGTKTGGPVSPELLQRWAARRRTINPLGQMEAICARLNDYYERHGERWPVYRDENLPRLKGWQ